MQKLRLNCHLMHCQSYICQEKVLLQVLSVKTVYHIFAPFSVSTANCLPAPEMQFLYQTRAERTQYLDVKVFCCENVSEMFRVCCTREVAAKCEALQRENERLRVENERFRRLFENSLYHSLQHLLLPFCV